MDHPHLFLALTALGGIWVIAVWVQARRATKKAARRLRRATGATSDVGRTIGIGAAIAGFEWLVVTHVSAWPVLLAALGLPALLAGRTVARLFAITEFARGDNR